MTRQNGLPRLVYLRHGRYYFVAIGGQWLPLTRERDGLPAMYRALANLTDREAHRDCMPAVIARWLQSKVDAGDWRESTKPEMEHAAKLIGKRFADFTPAQVTAPVVFEYLRPLSAKARTWNRHRSVLRQALSFAALEGLRDGHNPCDDVPQKKLKPRRRIVTDAEVAAIKAAFREKKRGGDAHCAMLDLCLLTGQRIGDVLRMRWQDVSDDGVLVDQGKTGAPLLIEWTAELRAVVDSCGRGRDRIGFLLVQSTGGPYTYAGVRSAWVKALAKAGIPDLNIHDLRGRAGADVADERGIYEAQKLLGHESVTMTEGYVRGKTRRRARPAEVSNSLSASQGKPGSR